MASIKSQAQSIETCYTPRQVKNINEFRKNCEKCELDLSDTRLALDECIVSPAKQDPSTLIFTGLGAGMLGFLIGSIVFR